MKMHELPDEQGHFGRYGGVFVAETLVHALDELRRAYEACRKDPGFVAEFEYELKHYVGRPSPVYHAKRWSQRLGGAQIYIKREDLNHTGANKINNTIGQALLAQRMGKPRVIAETGAGMHGVAAATVAARYGMECMVYMGSEDIKRQVQNVYRMKLLGAAVVPVESGSKTLKDALNEAMRDWVTNVGNTFYIIGTVAGPHPYPMMVRDFQSVIGRECLTQMPELCGRQPDAVIACVGGGSNAMGIFYPYIPYERVKLIGVEAGGFGNCHRQQPARPFARKPGAPQRRSVRLHRPRARRERGSRRRRSAVRPRQGLRERLGPPERGSLSRLQPALDRRSDPEAQTNREPLRFSYLAAQSGSFQLPEDAPDDGERDRLGPESAEHGRQHAEILLRPRHHRAVRPVEGLLFRYRQPAHSLRRRNEARANALYFRRQEMAGGGL